MRKLIYFVSVLSTMFLSCKARTQEINFVPAAGSPITVNSQPICVIVTDFNNDSKADLVSVSGDGNLTILQGDGTGRFTIISVPPSNIGRSAHIIAQGDLNRDGRIDIAAAQHDSYTITILLGDGRGGFTQAPGSPFPALNEEKAHNHGLILADFNKDSNLDIATSNHGNASVSVFLGKGDGTFSQASGSPFVVGRGPYPLTAEDLNGDGNLDIITPNLLSSSITLLQGDGKGGFTNMAGSPIPVQERPYYVSAGDINSDNHPDIVVSHDDINTITILLGDGKGAFTPASTSPLDIGHRTYKIILKDLNHDNKLDFIANTYPSYVSVMMGDGKGGFEHAKNSPIEVGKSPNGIDAADLNGDKKYDIVIVNTESNVLTILLGE